MRKMLFALALAAGSVFAFAGGTPASAATVGAVTGLGDVVQSDSGLTSVHYYRRSRFCYEYPWRCRRYGDYGYRRPYWRERRYYRPYYRSHRPWWW